MATVAQINANQSNAHQSTGPRTPEGKARVSQNAVRHGLTARRLVLRDDERAEFDALQSALLKEFNPEGPTENILFQELLQAAWNLHRIAGIEAELCSGGAADFTDPATAAALDRLGRYQSRNQRAYYKALNELRKLQTNRAVHEFTLHPKVQPHVSAILDIAHLLKQTQSADPEWVAQRIRVKEQLAAQNTN